MRRHKELSLRKPESTSLTKAIGYNKAIVSEFFSNLFSILRAMHFGPEVIFNVDEIDVTTVHKHGKVIAVEDEKQVSQATSGERGILVNFLLRKFCFCNIYSAFLIIFLNVYKRHYDEK